MGVPDGSNTTEYTPARHHQLPLLDHRPFDLMAAQTLTQIAVLAQSNTDTDTVNVGLGFGREGRSRKLDLDFDRTTLVQRICICHVMSVL